MPAGDEEEELARGASEEHEDEAEHGAEEARSAGATAAIADRNDAQAGAIVGRHRRGAVILGAPPMLGPVGRHRRGGVMLSAPPLGAMPGHHRVQERVPETLLASQMKMHRRGQAPLMGNEHSPLAAKTGMSDERAAAEMQKKRLAGQRNVGDGGHIESGFGGHGGGKRAKPTVAPALTGADKDNDLMRNVAHKQQEGTAAELAALGPGRAPGYRGKDEASADMRSIVEDPRFAKQYAVDRETDHGGAAGRFAAEKMQGISEFMASPDRGKQVGKYAARGVVRAIPLVGTGAAFAGAYKDHNRAGVDDSVAGDASQDALTRATATGLADSHRNNRNKEAVAGVVGLAKDVTTIATGGLSHLVPGMPGAEHGAHAAGSLIDRATAKAHTKVADAMTPEHLAERGAWKAGKKGGTAINKGADWLNDKRRAHELRKDAVAPAGVGRPDLIKEGTDRANEGALSLAAGDGKFGARLLNHLNAPTPAFAEPGLEHDAALPRVLKAARAVDPRDNKKAEHNLKPSQVSRMVHGEDARQRQKERMGGALGKLTENESSRSFWEKSAGVDVRKGGVDPTPFRATPGADEARTHAREAALAHSLGPTIPEHAQDGDEDEAEE